MITFVLCMIDKMTIKPPKESSLQDKREHAGHAVAAAFCSVPKSTGPSRMRLSSWALPHLETRRTSTHTLVWNFTSQLPTAPPSVSNHNDFQRFRFTSSICIQLSESHTYISSFSTHSRCLFTGFYYAVYNTLFLHRMICVWRFNYIPYTKCSSTHTSNIVG